MLISVEIAARWREFFFEKFGRLNESGVRMRVKIYIHSRFVLLVARQATLPYNTSSCRTDPVWVVFTLSQQTYNSTAVQKSTTHPAKITRWREKQRRIQFRETNDVVEM